MYKQHTRRLLNYLANNVLFLLVFLMKFGQIHPLIHLGFLIASVLYVPSLRIYCGVYGFYFLIDAIINYVSYFESSFAA